jgi:hypothetical protein
MLKNGMTGNLPDLALAIQLTLKLARVKDAPTTAEIRSQAQRVLQMLRLGGQALDVDEDQLVREVEARCNVFVASGSVLQDAKNHIEWLALRRGQIEWRFWERYHRWLEEVQDLEPNAVKRLDETTSDVLRLLEDPKRAGPWDRRGMVVGQVQSGKTGQYIGLISKAADAGYRLIVVLAGLHNSLRAQTQLRLDQGFLGFDTQRRMLDGKTELMGVGAMPGASIYPVHTLTNSSDLGDFKLSVAQQALVMVGGTDPILLVVKKNKSILTNLLRWATFLSKNRDPGSDRALVKGVPLLVIDDEADNASVDTSNPPEDSADGEETSPTAINGLIRQLLNSFEQSAYVGYTATPFANILIFKGASGARYGEDLFPRSFIIRLPAPSTYFGPLTVFGSKEDAAAGLEASPGLPIVRVVSDYAEWVRDRHKSDLRPGSLPPSVREALRAFVLVCAVRAARGHEAAHNSMLLHVTHFQAVQQHVFEQIQAELEFIQQRLKRGDGASVPVLLDELKLLWQRDFVPTTELIRETKDSTTWTEVRGKLHDAASRIEVHLVNGTVRDALQYYEHPEGRSLIAIGGNKLSRGLTLEGLSISYYLRSSRMYDTLMQMGRWFGYRTNYEDLCRLYTTEELREWYRDITVANEELLRMLDEMADVGATPEQFGLRIRTHPAGLMVTAAAKMRHGEKVLLSLARTLAETLILDIAPKVLEENLGATVDLIEAMGQPRPRNEGDSIVWEGVSPNLILAFLLSYKAHDRARKVLREPLMRYIEARTKDGELTKWTVALISIGSADTSREIGGFSVGLPHRSPDEPDALGQGRHVLRGLISPTDEAIDFTTDERQNAVRITQERWDPKRSRRAEPPVVASGAVLRELRSPERGLLLIYPIDPADSGLNDGPPVIGYAISFPGSSKAGTVEYVVNNIYYQQELGLT